MGITDFFKKQFVDVIQWTEVQDGVLVFRFPFRDMEIQNGAQLTVRDTQMALFVDQGKVADRFGPGLYKLTTQNLPVLTDLKNWDKAFESPFKSDVYFFSTRLQIDQKWGTATPVTIRDKEFGAVRFRAYGIYSYKLEDPVKFYTQVSGTREVYLVGDLEGQLRGLLISALSNLFGKSDIPFLDMAANQLGLGKLIGEALAPEFARLGLKLDSLMIQNISLPDEIQAKLDERISIGIIGNLGTYAKYQAAQSIPLAASNEGGAAGAGAGLGAGIAMGQTMAAAMGVGATAAGENPLAVIERLHELVKKGALTQEEFEAKKTELLKKITG